MKEMRSWHLVFRFWLCCQAAFVLLSAFDPLLHRYWGVVLVQPIWPAFCDLRVIMHAWVLNAHGVDPLGVATGDAAFNYPRLWLLPGTLGVPPQFYRWYGFIIAAAFLGCSAHLTRACGRKTLLAAWLFTLSGAWWLGLERANSDLAVFSLVFVSLLGAGQSGPRKLLTGGGLLLSAALKLFPALALPLLWDGSRGRRRLWLYVPLLLFALYAIATLPDLASVQRKTSHGDSMSYGLPLAVSLTWFCSSGKMLAAQTVWVAQSVGLAALLGASWLGWRGLALPARTSFGDLRFFWTGAAVYVFSFLAQINWAYRLCFLLLLFPALGTWLEASERSLRVLAGSALVLCVAAAWLLNVGPLGLVLLGHAASLVLAVVLSVLLGAAARRLFDGDGDRLAQG